MPYRGDWLSTGKLGTCNRCLPRRRRGLNLYSQGRFSRDPQGSLQSRLSISETPVPPPVDMSVQRHNLHFPLCDKNTHQINKRIWELVDSKTCAETSRLRCPRLWAEETACRVRSEQRTVAGKRGQTDYCRAFALEHWFPPWTSSVLPHFEHRCAPPTQRKK